jgi:hypothetical protein
VSGDLLRKTADANPLIITNREKLKLSLEKDNRFCSSRIEPAVANSGPANFRTDAG